jgi:hypothetical protein
MNPLYSFVGTPEVRLTEELAEVIQVVCKAQRWGWSGVNPEDGKDKKQRVLEELHDVIIAWNEIATRERMPLLLMTEVAL